MSRKVSDLKPWFQVKVREFRKRVYAETDHKLLVTRTLTTEIEQELLYKIGRTPLTEEEILILKNGGIWPGTEKRIVTKARDYKQTAHGLGLAFDAVPKRGVIIQWKASDNLWRRIYDIAEECGLDAMGDPWGEYMWWDKGHFSEPGWKLYR